MSEEPLPGSSDDMMNTIAALRARVAKLEAAAKAALLFHRGGEWTTEDQEAWFALTGELDATTKVLCDSARAALKDAPQ